MLLLSVLLAQLHWPYFYCLDVPLNKSLILLPDYR